MTLDCLPAFSITGVAMLDSEPSHGGDLDGEAVSLAHPIDKGREHNGYLCLGFLPSYQCGRLVPFGQELSQDLKPDEAGACVYLVYLDRLA